MSANTENYSALSESIAHCKACDLCESGRPAVPGDGAVTHPQYVIVGEQPGDQEDLQGEPFVGPAGKLLRSILNEIKAPLAEIYFTNAVKHFRFEARGKFRLHKTPLPRHIVACQPWLKEEFKLFKTTRVLCLGATAARSVFGKAVPVFKGRELPPAASPLGPEECFISVHPSAILRTPAPTRDEYRSMLKSDLTKFLRLEATA